MQKARQKQARDADIHGSFGDQRRPTYLRAGSEWQPRLGSDADRLAPQVDKQVFFQGLFDQKKRWQGEKQRKYQTMVFLLALARFYLVGLLELNCEINLIAGAK